MERNELIKKAKEQIIKFYWSKLDKSATSPAAGFSTNAEQSSSEANNNSQGKQTTPCSNVIEKNSEATLTDIKKPINTSFDSSK